jgi:hypothetical protein
LAWSIFGSNLVRLCYSIAFVGTWSLESMWANFMNLSSWSFLCFSSSNSFLRASFSALILLLLTISSSFSCIWYNQCLN